MDMSTMYLLTRLDPLYTLFGFMSCLGSIIGLISLLIFINFNIESNRNSERYEVKPSFNKKWFIFPIIFGLIGLTGLAGRVLTPTNEQLAVILGGYYATNSEEYSQMPDKAAKVVNKFMDQYLKEKKHGHNQSKSTITTD